MSVESPTLAPPVAQELVEVDAFTGGIIGPSLRMRGPVKDGGTIVASTAPGCWGADDHADIPGRP